MSDWNSFSPEKRRLMAYLMMGTMYEESLGVLITKEVKLMIGEEEYHYDGPEIRVKEGNLVSFGSTEEDVEDFEIIEANKELVRLKKILFFKAKLGGMSCGLHTMCVAATDRSNAFKIIREYCKDHGYEKILDVKTSSFFEPFIRE